MVSLIADQKVGGSGFSGRATEVPCAAKAIADRLKRGMESSFSRIYDRLKNHDVADQNDWSLGDAVN